MSYSSYSSYLNTKLCCKDPVGPQGVPGPTGPTGAQGVTGPQGVTGAQGAAGITGVSAGPNITIDSTTNPLIPAVSLANPFNAGADIGSQQVQGLVGDINMDLMGDHLNYVNTSSGLNSSYTPVSIVFSDQVGDVLSSLDNYVLNLTDTPNGAVASLGADIGLNIKPLPLSASGVELTYSKFEMIEADPVAGTASRLIDTQSNTSYDIQKFITPAGLFADIETSCSATGVLITSEYNDPVNSIQTFARTDANATQGRFRVSYNEGTIPIANFSTIECASNQAVIRQNIDDGTNTNFTELTTQTSGFAIDTGQDILFSSINLQSTPSNFKLLSGGMGGQANPLLTLTNTNNTNTSVALEVYKDKPIAGVAGDVLFNQSVYGKDSGNAKQEFTRISHTLKDPTAGVEDGSIEFACLVNGVLATFLQINGNENEINATKPLDMVGNNIRTSVGSFTLTTNLSTGLGNITLTPKAGAVAGTLFINNLPTSNVGLTAGAVWNNLGVLNIV